MWCYSLRFPRIKRIKMGQTFMECISFQDLQELGRDSISTQQPKTKSEPVNVDESYTSKPVQKRVRFVTEESAKMLKSDFYVHLSKRIRLAEREKLTEWLEYRGFELIWSLEALKQYGQGRRVLYISSCSSDSQDEEFKLRINYETVMEVIKVEGAYFSV